MATKATSADDRHPSSRRSPRPALRRDRERRAMKWGGLSLPVDRKKPILSAVRVGQQLLQSRPQDGVNAGCRGGVDQADVDHVEQVHSILEAKRR
jgi:hypothetical protein